MKNSVKFQTFFTRRGNWFLYFLTQSLCTDVISSVIHKGHGGSEPRGKYDCLPILWVPNESVCPFLRLIISFVIFVPLLFFLSFFYLSFFIFPSHTHTRCLETMLGLRLGLMKFGRSVMSLRPTKASVSSDQYIITTFWKHKLVKWKRP